MPAQPLNVPSPLNMNQSLDVTLPLNSNGPVQRMEPIASLQVAVKNNIDVMYFSALASINALFLETGEMGEWIKLHVLSANSLKYHYNFKPTNIAII